MKKYVTVIGGCNLDLTGIPFQPLVPATSNPGRIYQSAGGVGRNIAHNLALLGVPVYLLSALGDDGPGREILQQTRSAGVRTDHLRILPETRSGIYLSVLDRENDLALALSDMEATQKIDSEYLVQHEALICRSSVVVLETNLETESLCYVVELCRRHGIPYLIEPVSVEKSKKLLDIPGRLDAICPNWPELNALAQQRGSDEAPSLPSLEALAGALEEKFETLLVTLGEKGVFYYRTSERQGTLYPPPATQVLDVNGAGDAFAAGFACGCFYHDDIARSIRLGLAAACLTLQSKQTVSPELSLERCHAVCHYE